MAFKLTLVSDVREVIKGTSSVADSLDEVADALDDVGRDASDASRATVRALDGVGDALGDVSTDSRDAGRDLSRNLGDGAKDSTTAVERMERSFRDSLDAVRTESADAGDAVGRNLREGTEDGASGASETVGEFKDEAVANFAETASSFSGDMGSAVDLVQGTLGGLAGSIPGGLGMALGGLALAGGAFAAAWQKAAELTEARTSEMYEDMLASGKAYISDSYIQDQYYAIVQGAEDAILSQKDLEKIVGQTGLTQEQVALAFAGNGEQMALVQDKLAANQEVFNKQLEDSIDTNDSAAKSGISWVQQSIDQAQQRSEAIAKTEGDYKRAAEALAVYGTVGAGAVRELEAAEIAYQETAEASAATIAENGATLDTTTAAGRANSQALLDIVDASDSLNEALRAAGGTTADLTTATEMQRAKFVATATAAGLTEVAAEGLADAYGLVPETVTTAVAVTGTDTAKADLDGVTAPRTVSITPTADKTGWQTFMDNMAAGLRPPVVTVAPRAGQQAP